jgi:hypothetical protein
VAHTAVAVHEAVQWICEQTGTAPEAIAIGIETPRGVLVDTFIELGFSVFALNPKQLDRFRDRFTVAGAKDDAEDAHVLGDALRTDRRAFRRVRPDDPLMIQLREGMRVREDLQEDERRLTNRLRDPLYRVDAAWLTLSPAAGEPWLWAILADAPDPALWAPLTRRRVGAAWRAYRMRRVSADDVLQTVRQPRLTVAPGVTDAVTLRIAALVAQLPLVHEQRTSAASIACWNGSRPWRAPRTSRGSLVTSRFSSPCQGSEDWWPPRCSRKRQAHWPSGIIPRCGPTPARHR